MTTIKFAGVSPHPPIIVPEVGRGRERQTQATLDALAQVAAEMSAQAPHTVVLIATHGPTRPAAFSALAAPVAKGDFAQWGAPKVRLQFETDQEAVTAIHEEARHSNVPLEPIRRWGDGLDWSCTVPLYHLQRAMGEAKLVCLTISHLSPQHHFALGQAVRRTLDRLGRPAAIIASADLSHRLSEDSPYGFDPAGPEFDRRICEAVARWDVAAILDMDTDFRMRAGDDTVPPLSFLMGTLDGLRVRPRVLSYEGPWGVGYLVAAIDILDDREPPASVRQGERGTIADSPVTAPPAEHARAVTPGHLLARIACEAVEAWVRRRAISIPDAELPPDLPQRAGVFVSIKTADGFLRGCIGTVEPGQDSLLHEVVHNAIDAATRDPRYLPLTPEELGGLSYSIDVLSPPEPVEGPEALDARRYGIIVQNGYRRGLLLPDLEGV
ncbi:MAG: AmmeMemoRadiSam system protein A, partial [Dehalococcoidia bacterium]